MSTEASIEAYVAIVDHLPKKRAAVFAAISNAGGTTIREACQHLTWPWTTVSARIHELAEAGMIKSSGLKRDGQTVWIRSMPQEIEVLKKARAERKAGVQAKIVSHEFHGDPNFLGRETPMRIVVTMTLGEWDKLKNKETGRFA